MLNVTLMTCLVSGSPIKQEILELLKLSPFSCSLGSQEHRFVTRSALTDGFNYFLNITNKYSVAACFLVLDFLHILENSGAGYSGLNTSPPLIIRLL